MKISTHPEALAEIEETIAYYRLIELEIAFRFRDRLSAGFEKIKNNPHAYPLRKGNFRRINLPQFPYYLIFQVAEETIFLAAVAHERRRPFYWKRRLSGN